MHTFEGKTAVVTGAASGIGRALAERFAAARMQVVLADIEKDALERTVRELEDRQHRVIAVVTNTMRRDSVRALAERAIAEFGKVHVLCNNAGVATLTGFSTPIWDVSDNDWQWVMGVNFWGVLYGIQAFLPHMVGHGEEGHVVNTASLAALLPSGGTYGVSKHGVLALSETLLRDLKTRNAKIGASVLCPGFVNTQIFTAERNRPAELGRVDLAAYADLLKTGSTMIAQQGKRAEDVADDVFRAIQEQRFYVLPHTELDGAVRERVERVLARTEPMDLLAASGLRATTQQ
jgi:NAD(P)-dependent dehydrogenase (short-subunit alcohol dehydrogenase family)